VYSNCSNILPCGFDGLNSSIIQLSANLFEQVVSTEVFMELFIIMGAELLFIH
jgi:hypothetical protein